MALWSRSLRQAAHRALQAAAASSPSAAASSYACCVSAPAWPVLRGSSWGGLGAAHSFRGFTASAANGAVTPAPRACTPPRHSFQQVEKPPGWGSSGGGQSPFTPTRLLVKRKSLFKRTAHIMQTLEHEAALAAAAQRPLPPFRPGDVLDVQVTLPENKGRPSAFRGLVIAVRNRGIASCFHLRSVVNNFVVERSFPLYSPHVQNIAVVERRKSRRAKLYYLRRKEIKYSRVVGGGGAGGAARVAGAAGADVREAEGKRGGMTKPAAAKK